MTRHDPPSPDLHAAALAENLRVLIGKLKRRMRGQTPLGDLTWSQVAVLRYLEREGPATVTTLARAEGMRPQSMSANVAALETAGLVQGTPDPQDGRQTILSLTQACRELVDAGRAARQDWLLRAIQTHLNPAEQEELARGIELLRRLAES
jgi:DNA-binding MarR family transcriptional regulator